MTPTILARLRALEQEMRRSLGPGWPPNWSSGITVNDWYDALAAILKDAEAYAMNQDQNLLVAMNFDGKESFLRQLAAFLRHDAMMQRTPPNHRWDIPETMANAYEAAARRLDEAAACAEQAEAERTALKAAGSHLRALLAVLAARLHTRWDDAPTVFEVVPLEDLDDIADEIDAALTGAAPTAKADGDEHSHRRIET